MAFCQSCGIETVAGYTFCSKCGAKLATAAPAPPPPPPAVPLQTVQVMAVPVGTPVATAKDNRGQAIAGFVLGLVSFVLNSLVAWFILLGVLIGAPLAIVGFILSIVGLRSSGRGLAIAGIVLSSLAFLFAVMLFVLAIIGVILLSSSGYF